MQSTTFDVQSGDLSGTWWWIPDDREVISVSGPDAGDFLQRMLTQDISTCAVGDGIHAALLEPRGHLVADLFLFRVEQQRYWLLSQGNAGDEVRDGLQRFLIRTDAKIELMQSLALLVTAPTGFADGDIGGVPITGIRWDLGGITWVQEHPGNRPSCGVQLSNLDWARARISRGVGIWGRDLDTSVLPHEAGLERDAISFTKGCFLGQEVVCRIDARGRVTRTLRVCQSDQALHPGMELGVDGKTKLTITSSVQQESGRWIALGWVHHEVPVGTVLSNGSIEVTVLNERD